MGNQDESSSSALLMFNEIANMFDAIGRHGLAERKQMMPRPGC